ncbi:sensor histidine kinase [Geodermatophilus sabuli]|uniref:Oxygen sensor histidine kinase NreB n=1 Tax=Geodermatophilus sabuli TaxID=1564158 RepID=A0A7K3VWP6_9ACTN|nr:sensor histidine kinase [Geodermatophilus sabuli]
MHGILAGVGGTGWLDGAVVLLTTASAIRYVDAHGADGRTPAVLAGAAVLVAVYALQRRAVRHGHRRRAIAGCLALVATWLVLVVLAPSFSWVAVPLSFVALRVLPYAAAGAVVAGMTATVVVAWTLMLGAVDPTIVVGPACVAGLAVLAYRALDREAVARQELLGELQEAQGDLVEAQHSAGALAERARLSREIHDSVAQGFSSINLLLQAAEQSWSARPDAARQLVAQAAATAREGLDEARRVVRDLAPAEVSAGAGPALEAALRRTCERAVQGTDVRVAVHVDGRPVDVPADVATAVLRTARGALANVVEHAGASTATVSLTYQPDTVSLDVRDDGRGFDVRRSGTSRDGRGSGLAGIRSRADQFGGAVAVETAPGEGTAIAVSIPLRSADGRR